MTTGDLVEQFVTQFYGRRVDATTSDEHPARGAGAGAARRRRRAGRWLSERRGSRVAHAGAAARRQAGAARDRRTQRRAGAHPAQAQARVRPHRAVAGAGRAAGRARAADVAAAHRVLRHQPRAGHQRGRQHGRVRGRPGPQERVPPVRDARGHRRHRLDRRGRAAPVRPLPRRAGGVGATPTPTRRPRPRRPTARRASTRPPGGRASSPTRRTCWSSTAARRRSPRRRRCSTSSASTTSRSSGWPSGWRRSGCRGEQYPVILPRTSEGLYLLQRVRDEAHRFAITYHRQKRSKAMTTSALDGIPGLGETRRKALLRTFGSLKRLRAATVDDMRRGARHRAGDRGGDRRRAGRRRRVRRGAGRQRHHRGGAGAREHRRRRWRRRSDRAGDERSREGGQRRVPATTGALETVVVTGLSGAGRSTAAKCLEDLGLLRRRQPAAGADRHDGRPRQPQPGRDHPHRRRHGRPQPGLLHRPARGHPRPRRPAACARACCSWRPATTCWSAGSRTSGARIRCRATAGWSTASTAERALLGGLRDEADLVIDTSDRSVHELRRAIESAFAGDGALGGAPDCAPRCVSFGYKYGLPVDADLVVDVRFLPNPYWIPELRELTGEDDRGARLRPGPARCRGVPRPLHGHPARSSAPGTAARASTT